MRWLHFSNVGINRVEGKVRRKEPWISTDEIKRDSGMRKGIEYMNMEITLVCEDQPIRNDYIIYLHFKDDKPSSGIKIGWLIDE